MRDGLVRRAIKRVFRFQFGVDVAVFRAVSRLRRQPSFDLGGECRRCAACCEAPAIRVGWLTWYLPTLFRAFVWWQRRINGFELASRDVAHRVATFTCTHFDAETHRCDSYDSRPGMCRDYPRVQLYQPHPEMLAGCGYRPLRSARETKRFLRVLDEQSLTPEQKARLKKDLFLE